MAEHLTNIAKQQTDTLLGKKTYTPDTTTTGRIAYARVTYTTTTATAGDTIKLVLLPKGSTIIPHLSKIITEAMGTALSIKIGDSAKDDRYSTPVAIQAAGNIPFANAPTDLDPYPLPEQDWIIATITTATALTPGKKATLYIAHIPPSH